MRIAFTHAYCWPEVRRGAERFTQSLGAALVRRGHEVEILAAAYETGTTELDGVVTKRLQRKHEAQWPHEADVARRLLPWLLTGRYDAVHSMGRRDAVASIVAAKVHRKRRTVITDLGLPSREWWDSVGPDEARAVERVVKGIDVYSCMSQYALDYLARDYGRTDGVVVPGGVDLSSFQPAAARTATPTILFSGALDEPRKGIATLLEALPMVAKVESEVRVWLSGPGDPSPFLDAASPEAVERTEVLGRGEADKQHERYGQAWTTTLPSISDSFGMALIESLACGTPLVVTTDGAPQELVDPGVNGEICEPKDAEGLAAALLRVFDLTRKGQVTVDACRERARRFDWDEGLAPLCERLYQGGR